MFLKEIGHGYRGSSPRVRSGPLSLIHSSYGDGIISACAERTTARPFLSRLLGDHLRVCGADIVWIGGVVAKVGSSPRVRSGQLYSTVV